MNKLDKCPEGDMVSQPLVPERLYEARRAGSN